MGRIENYCGRREEEYGQNRALQWRRREREREVWRITVEEGRKEMIRMGGAENYGGRRGQWNGTNRELLWKKREKRGGVWRE